MCGSQTRRFTINNFFVFFFTLVFQIVSQLFITSLRRNANTSARDLCCPLKNCWNCFSCIAVRQRCKGSRFFHSIIHFLLVLTRCSQRMGHSISCVGIPLPKNTGSIFVSVGNYFMMAYQREWLKKCYDVYTSYLYYHRFLMTNPSNSGLRLSWGLGSVKRGLTI